MRTRAEIEADALRGTTVEGIAARLLACQLEVLLDVRELLQVQAADVAICEHGVTGLCMACVIRNDLLRPRT